MYLQTELHGFPPELIESRPLGARMKSKDGLKTYHALHAIVVRGVKVGAVPIKKQFDFPMFGFWDQLR